MKLFMDDNITDRQNGSGVSDNDVIQVYQNDFDSFGLSLQAIL